MVYTAKGEQSTDIISYGSHEHRKKMKNTYPMSAIYRMENVEVIEIDFVQKYGVKESLFHAFLADLIRIKKTRRAWWSLVRHGHFVPQTFP